jgi:hypothetical protein
VGGFKPNCQAQTFVQLAKEESSMNVQLIHIEQLNSKQFPAIFKPQKSKDYEYIGIAIEDEGTYYYWAKGVSLKIAKHEYDFIKANPKLYYFSTALKLHFRVERCLLEGLNNGL